MSFDEFKSKIKRYAAKAKINAGNIVFSTDEGIHTARYSDVTMTGGTANNTVKITWGHKGHDVSPVYGRRRESIVTM